MLNRRRKALFLFLFTALVSDLSLFTLFHVYPQVFAYLTNIFGLEALGLVMVGGIIIAIAASAMLLILSYKELKTIVG